MRRSWVEISLSRIQKNVAAVEKHLSPSTRIIAVVKANAYGHGVGRFSQCLLDCGIQDFAVATPGEAVELRKYVKSGKILVFGSCLPGEETTFRKYDLTAALFERRALPNDIKVEVKIDTGMNRLGISWEDAPAVVRGLNAQITGLYSHFACADKDLDFSRLQLQRFEQATSNLPYPRHISGSAGLQFPEAHLDAVRLGLALYGISPCPAVDYVKPALCWKTQILSVKEVLKGQPIGYGRAYVTQRNAQVGVLPIG
ncbi:MAG: alanine racemase, partial [Acidobacteriota bacterium]